MDSDSEDNFDLLDLLAFDCTNLLEELSSTSSEAEHEYILENHIRAAEKKHNIIADFKEDLDWINVSEPLNFSKSLRGKVVVLDFFTYCCINCLHILPDLKKLEEKYSIEDGLVIIGVHSAKFENEKNSANILSAIQRHNITHPVVNDISSSMWIELKIKCWPTLLILGPYGHPLFVLMGEGHYDTLEKYTTAAMNFYKNKKLINNAQLPIDIDGKISMMKNLKFPGKIVCAKNNNIFAISDTGNNRILIVNHLGDVLKKIGGKTSGFIDGDFQTARFYAPQGISFLNEHIIFVADTENHAIRRIDLKNQCVETVVGNGQQGTDRVGGNIGKDQSISSPWDVVCHKTRDMDMSFHMDDNLIPEKNIILIAMSGTHQIWALFLEDIIWWKFKKFPAYSCVAICGSGHEENRNNSYPQNAAFAQPSGITIGINPNQVFIADSESSCIRKISLTDGKVMPVVGGDRNPLNLFAFGDKDGTQFDAKLQHPLGVTYSPAENCVYVADTYNHKIKKIDILTNSIRTLKVNHSFNEPGGLCINSAGSLLYVADTNNHSIEIIDLNTMTIKPFTLNFNVKENIIKEDFSLKLDAFKITKQGGKLKLAVSLQFDEIKLTENAPQTWIVYLPDESYIIDRQNGKLLDSKIEIDVTIPKTFGDSNDSIKMFVKLNQCSNEMCFQKVYLIIIPIEFDDNGLNCIIEDVTILISKIGLQMINH